MGEKILYIKSSLSENSVSHQVAKNFLAHYQKQNPTAKIIELDLNNSSAARNILNTNNFANFYKSDSSKTSDALDFIYQLKSVDKLVLSAPMYNFNVPTTLKSWIDHIMLADQTFSYKYSKKGEAIGLVTNLKKVLLVTSQGAPEGWYLWGDHTKYLEGCFKFIGAKKIFTIALKGLKKEPFISLSPTQIAANLQAEIDEKVQQFSH